MKTAVVGGSGYIGRNLCAALQQRGDEVVSISAGRDNGISIVTGLFPEDFSFPQGVEAVYYLSQSPHYRRLPEASIHVVAVNCMAAIQAAFAAREAGVKRFVYASTGNVYVPSFEPLTEASPLRRDNWYSLSKVMGEDALCLFRPDMAVTVARIFGVYGPGQQDKLVPNLVHSLQTGGPISVDRNPCDPHDRSGLRISLIYVDDLVCALMNLLSLAEGITVNLAGPKPMSIRDIAYSIGVLLGVDPVLEEGTRFREGDLIADTTKYSSLFPHAQYTPAELGLNRLVQSIQKSTSFAHSPLP